MKKDYQKMKYKLNPEIKEQCKKRYQNFPELHKKNNQVCDHFVLRWISGIREIKMAPKILL